MPPCPPAPDCVNSTRLPGDVVLKAPIVMLAGRLGRPLFPVEPLPPALPAAPLLPLPPLPTPVQTPGERGFAFEPEVACAGLGPAPAVPAVPAAPFTPSTPM